jgi:hypothetical protein
VDWRLDLIAGYGSRVASRLVHRQLWFDTCQDLKIVVPAAARRRILGGDTKPAPPHRVADHQHAVAPRSLIFGCEHPADLGFHGISETACASQGMTHFELRQEFSLFLSTCSRQDSPD